jgi:hypothetical protein
VGSRVQLSRVSLFCGFSQAGGRNLGISAGGVRVMNRFG